MVFSLSSSSTSDEGTMRKSGSFSFWYIASFYLFRVFLPVPIRDSNIWRMEGETQCWHSGVCNTVAWKIGHLGWSHGGLFMTEGGRWLTSKVSSCKMLFLLHMYCRVKRLTSCIMKKYASSYTWCSEIRLWWDIIKITR